MVRKDFNLKIFLEYEEELAVRGKNVKEKISEFFGIVQVCHQSQKNHPLSKICCMVGQRNLAAIHQPPKISNPTFTCRGRVENSFLKTLNMTATLFLRQKR